MNNIVNAINRVVEKLTQLVEVFSAIPIYTLQVLADNQATLTDGQTIYLGALAGRVPDTNAAISKIYIPKDGYIKKAHIIWHGATAGSGENISCYIRVNNTSDTLIQTLGNTNALKEFLNTTLNIAVVAGDYIEIKFVYPTWATNPANVKIGGVVYIEKN